MKQKTWSGRVLCGMAGSGADHPLALQLVGRLLAVCRKLNGSRRPRESGSGEGMRDALLTGCAMLGWFRPMFGRCYRNRHP